jgi:acetyl-CoA carboxylase biotin carboxyl carrier protein
MVRGAGRGNVGIVGPRVRRMLGGASFRRAIVAPSRVLAGDGRFSGGQTLTRSPIDPDTIRALAAVLTETGLTEIEIADKDSRIRVVRQVATTVVPVAASAPVVAAPAVAAPAAVPAGRDASAHPGAVTSPMVGVAYLSPEPGAAAFVTVGQSVVAGQTLLLIEAM